jgi:hypothetical protein
VLVAVGTLTWRSARQPSERPLAAIPLLFAVQQLIEGVVWLSFRDGLSGLNEAATLAYAFFSHAFWPAYVPVAVFLIEPLPSRQHSLAWLVGLGLAVSAWLFFATFRYGVASEPSGRHIEYVSSHAFARGTALLYLLATTTSLLLSSHQTVKIFGVLTVIGFVVSYVFYSTWLVSVWCYFAALLSLVVLLHFRRAGRAGGTESAGQGALRSSVP